MKLIKSKLLYNILIYISFIFLFIYLIRTDYINFDKIQFNYIALAASIVLFWIGITMSSLSWGNALKVHHITISSKNAVISHGLSIFAKYIPGKIWVVLGRATYVSNLGYSINTSSLASLKEQLIYVWTGIGISIIPVLIYYGIKSLSILVFGIFILLTIFLFLKPFHNTVIKLINRVFKKDIQVPALRFSENTTIILFCSAYWIIWMVGFYFFSYSIYPKVTIMAVFAFPLGVTLGLLAIIIPSGLGVREGIISGYLILTGIPEDAAISISFLARFWFLSGEIFIFLFAVLLRLSKKNSKQ
ncbi:MAG: flippase-like domain-containing protein [Bacteroidetes bacterium]|nr:flippase-like domain-containing protein [Bacteroidota bacterium]